MSVPVNQRSHGKLEAAVKARDLASYTLKITANRKIFAEEYQEALTDRIIAAAITIHTKCWSANNVLVNSREDMARRLVRKSLRGEIPPEKVWESYSAWRNHASKGNTYQLLRKMDKYYHDLWRDEHETP